MSEETICLWCVSLFFFYFFFFLFSFFTSILMDTGSSVYQTTMEESLSFPPLPEGFLALFGPGVRVQWTDPQRGLFTLHHPTGEMNLRGAPGLLASEPRLGEIVVETPSVLQVPDIPVENRCSDPPLCYHGRPSAQFTCKQGNNKGRVFYVCAWNEGKRCNMFQSSFFLEGWGVVSTL